MTSSIRTPLWQAIAASLRKEIAAGTYPNGSKLPTEAALSARFGVNRHTVRRALAVLGEEGLVYARRGSGVFVTENVTDYPIGKRVRFHRNLEAAGKVPGREALAVETRRGTAKECEPLGLRAGTVVHVYDGLSLADEVPLALCRSIFPGRLKGLAEALRELGSVTAALRTCGISDYTRSSTRISAKRATATQAGLLRIKEGDPLIRSTAVNLSSEGDPVEFGTTWFVGERVTLTIAGS